MEIEFYLFAEFIYVFIRKMYNNTISHEKDAILYNKTASVIS